ncbi:c-type cytochrome [Aureimonas frigidaquae]|uniref:Putative cytochrome c 553 n=1 Tax=Aureimonas frigidaquae TaxID=424757 RepID=A0A0N7KXL6_9HYPH|nr:c-type cytochrome [Aureimonas frigidaquae]BAT27265.1 putative cytochrome c 553 [Aureimonas frigidaquae]
MKLRVVITGRRLLYAALAVPLLALGVGWSGLVSIAASSGHYAPVGWFLHWTMQNAVATQSIGIAVPDGVSLSDPLLVRRGAGHFQSNCAACHGAPGQPQSAAMRAMTPPPPPLDGAAEKWRDRELFWIVQHGIKYSGMPAWASQDRPDEVWAMVAFLKTLPQLDTAAWRDLAYGAAWPGGGTPGDFPSALADCSRCHGRDGAGAGAAGTVPVIAGQPEAYLLSALRAFATGERESGIMQPAASIHTDARLTELARWYAGQPLPAGTADALVPPPAGVAAGSEGHARLPRGSVAQERELEVRLSDQTVHVASAYGPPYEAEGLAALGRDLAERGLPERKIPACESCHGAAARAKGVPYPYLSGQPEWYIATQLQLWKDGKRAGTAHAHVMSPIAITMTQEQIDAVALWYAQQPAGR